MSGTTDGASIPEWAQPIIGKPYDESYLKAAIIHDHYCYEENHVRTWRQTHRMFYDALIDLGVDQIKAKIMYAAVYIGGPKWVTIVPGQNCGINCVNNVYPSGQRWDSERFGSEDFTTELNKFQEIIQNAPEISLDEIDEIAQQMNPENFFYNQGSTYSPVGSDDPNIDPTQ